MIKSRDNNYLIDLFSGAGGLSKGLELAGFNSVLGIDFDKDSIETYKYNHPSSSVILGDISKVTLPQIKKIVGNKKIKLICGGPPCQGFSTVGTNNPSDKRNNLFLEFVRIVKGLMPDYLIIENVTGLLSKRNEKTLNSIIKFFTDLGYVLDIKVLSAHHYGVPETRRRTIILGNKFGVRNIFPEALFKDSKKTSSDFPEPRTVAWALDNLVYLNKKIAYNHNLEAAKINNELEVKRLRYIPEGQGVRYEEDQLKYLPKNLWFDIDWSKISEGRFRQTKLKRLSFSEPSPTINTSKTTYYHPKSDRYLTPREAAAIQSFPADFKFLGTPSSQWKQIGNAVPPILAMEIGKAILKLDKKKDSMTEDFVMEDISAIRSRAFVYRQKDFEEIDDVQTELNFT